MTQAAATAQKCKSVENDVSCWIQKLKFTCGRGHRDFKIKLGSRGTAVIANRTLKKFTDWTYNNGTWYMEKTQSQDR